MRRRRAAFSLLIFALLLSLPMAAATADRLPATRSVIIDTDAGTDDLMAIAMLLSRSDLRVEAITISNGLAHVPAGAHNVLRLLALAGRSDIAVYEGRGEPLRGNAAFPPAWRELTDTLPGVTLPNASRSPERRPAADFLAERMAESRSPVEVLALGPLTNIAEAFARRPEAARRVRSIVIMGGALRVGGNLRPGWPEANDAAEFNIYVDPEAAREVFRSGARLLLVPLDATNHVPIDRQFVEDVRTNAVTPAGRMVVQVLDALREFVESKTYFAWDPLTAAVLIDPSIARTTRGRLTVSTSGPRIGQTSLEPRRSSARVATSIDTSAFRRMFIASLR